MFLNKNKKGRRRKKLIVLFCCNIRRASWSDNVQTQKEYLMNLKGWLQ